MSAPALGYLLGSSLTFAWLLIAFVVMYLSTLSAAASTAGSSDPLIGIAGAGVAAVLILFAPEIFAEALFYIVLYGCLVLGPLLSIAYAMRPWKLALLYWYVPSAILTSFVFVWTESLTVFISVPAGTLIALLLATSPLIRRLVRFGYRHYRLELGGKP